MKRVLVCIVLLASFILGIAHAGTKYRAPLSYNYPGIGYWFDHNPNTGFLRYDSKTGADGYGYDGHHGVDFNSSFGYGIWAGASGVVIYTVNTCPDGGVDQNCAGRLGNHVRLLHPDGTVSIYAHMKQGSVVASGSVLCSALLGQVGTSGETTGPHLHFVVWSDQNASQRIDPFGGVDSNGGYSYWVNQNGGLPTTQCQ